MVLLVYCTQALLEIIACEPLHSDHAIVHNLFLHGPRELLLMAIYELILRMSFSRTPCGGRTTLRPAEDTNAPDGGRWLNKGLTIACHELPARSCCAGGQHGCWTACSVVVVRDFSRQIMPAPPLCHGGAR